MLAVGVFSDHARSDTTTLSVVHGQGWAHDVSVVGLSAWTLPPWDRTDSPYRSTSECAAFLGKYRKTGALNLNETRELLKRERVQPYKVGGSLRYRRDDIERLVRPVAIGAASRRMPSRAFTAVTLDVMEPDNYPSVESQPLAGEELEAKAYWTRFLPKTAKSLGEDALETAIRRAWWNREIEIALLLIANPKLHRDQVMELAREILYPLPEP
jgi:hypothetical protein